MTEYTPTERETIATTIIRQITRGVLMSLGAHGLTVRTDGGLNFKARILPKPTSQARVMSVAVTLNGRDLYDITVGYRRGGRNIETKYDWVTHYEAADVPAEALARTLLALDNVI